MVGFNWTAWAVAVYLLIGVVLIVNNIPDSYRGRDAIKWFLQDDPVLSALICVFVVVFWLPLLLLGSHVKRR